MLVNLTVTILSEGGHLPNHHVVHAKYITVLFVSDISVKLNKRKRGGMSSWVRSFHGKAERLRQESLSPGDPALVPKDRSGPLELIHAFWNPLI